MSEHICERCHHHYDHHRGSDDLCPASNPDGSVWHMAWEKEGAPGTRFKGVRKNYFEEN